MRKIGAKYLSHNYSTNWHVIMGWILVVVCRLALFGML